jgi:1,4-alpha-glucan branching enzyme
MSRHDARRATQNGKTPVETFKPGSPHELKKTEFSLEALSAKSVKLAGDFTDWEKAPLEMTKAKNGIWRVEVPLASGNYSYRFIVDGQWSDDPQCNYHIPNSFGSQNATRKVA